MAVTSTPINTNIHRYLLLLVALSASQPCAAVEIPSFEIPLGESLLLLNDFEQDRKGRIDKDRQAIFRNESISLRQITHVAKEKRVTKHDEWALVYWTHKKSREGGSRGFMEYEDHANDGLKARFYFKGDELVILPLVEEEPLTEAQMDTVKRTAKREIFFYELARLASSRNWQIGETHDLEDEFIKAIGGDFGSVSLARIDYMWEKSVAEFQIQTAFENGTDCELKFLTLVESGRPLHINMACRQQDSRTGPEGPFDFYYRDYLSQSFSYTDMPISELSPEPTMGLQPKGKVLDLEFSEATGQLAFLTQDYDSNTNFISYWDLNQRKVVYSRPHTADELVLSRNQETLMGIGHGRLHQGWIKIDEGYQDFGRAMDFNLADDKKIIDSALLALYPVTLNAGGELEIWNLGYNHIVSSHPITIHEAKHLTLAADGRLITVSNDGAVAVHALKLTSLCERPIDEAFCDVVETEFTEAETTIPIDFQLTRALGEIHVHPSEPWLAYCSEFPANCGAVNYQTKQQFGLWAGNVLFDSTGALLTDNGEFNLENGEFKHTFYNSYYPGMAFSESNQLLFNQQPRNDHITDRQIVVSNQKDGSVIDTIARKVFPVSELVVLDESNFGFFTAPFGTSFFYGVDIANLSLQGDQFPAPVYKADFNDGWLVGSGNGFTLLLRPDDPDQAKLFEFTINSFQLTEEFLIYAREQAIYRYGLYTGETETLHEFESPVHEIAVLDDSGDRVVARLNYGVFALPHVQKELELPYSGGIGEALALSADKSSFFVSGLRGFSPAYNPAIEVIQQFNADGEPIQEMAPVWGDTSAMYVDHQQQLWSGGKDGSLLIRDSLSGLIIERISAHQGSINVIKQLNAQTIITGSTDGSVKLWRVDMANGKFSSSTLGVIHPTFIAKDIGKRKLRLIGNVTVDHEGEYIVNLADGYYWATPKGLHNASFKNGENIFDYARFDYWLNRPDLVIQRLNKPNQLALTQWQKMVSYRQGRNNERPKTIPASFDQFSLSIKGPDNIVVPEEVSIDYQIAGKQATTLHVTVNQVPIFGTAGKKIRAGKGSITVPLTAGNNRIRAYVADKAGLPSGTEYLTYYHPTTDEKNDLYILAVGVSEYSGDRLDLDYASKDAKDLITALEQSKQFREVKSLAILDESAKRKDILKAKQFLQKASAKDSVIVFFAGHGLLDREDNYFFGTTDIDPDNPAKKGLAYAEMTDLLDGLPARQKLMLMDTCYSGEVTESASNIELPPGVTTRGLTFASESEVNISLGMLQKTFVDLRASTGAIVISAAGGREYALEREGIQNGIFTASLIKALTSGDQNNDGQVTISELRTFTYDEVSRLSNGAQKPTARKHNLDIDFAIF